MSAPHERPRRASGKRFEERHKVTLHVRMTILGRKAVSVETMDISHHGLFLKTDTPPDQRSLVKLAIEVPGGRTLNMHGMAVHLVRPGDPSGRTAGVGIQFYALDKETQNAWIEQVRRIAFMLAAGKASDRRVHPRYAAELDIEVQTVDDLRMLYSRDVSEGGMFVVSDVLFPLGATLCVRVLHPATGRAFPLEAIVRRQEYHPTRGLGVEFLNMDTQRRASFMEFIQGSFELGDEVFEVMDIDLLAG